MTNTSSDLVAYVDRQDATHFYGRKIEAETRNLTDALLDAGMLGWNVRQEAVFTADGFEVQGHKAIVGDVAGEKVSFAVAKSRYTVLDYMNAFGFGQTILDRSDMTISALGYHRGGGRAFVEFRTPDTIEIAGVDTVQPYLRILSSHDMTSPVVATMGAVRLRCTHQMDTLLGRTAPSFRVKHVGMDPLGRASLQDARSALGIVSAGIDQFTAQAEQWAQTEVTNAQFDEIVSGLLPMDPNTDSSRVQSRALNSREAVADVVRYSGAQDGLGMTAYSVFQGIVEWQQWSGNKAPDQRAERALSGRLEAGQRRASGLITDVLQLA